eukprot:359247-Chlamydomonas_euryale.AAC.4
MSEGRERGRDGRLGQYLGDGGVGPSHRQSKARRGIAVEMPASASAAPPHRRAAPASPGLCPRRRARGRSY